MQCEPFKQYKQLYGGPTTSISDGLFFKPSPKELVGNVQALSFGHFVSPFLPKAILTNVSESQWNGCKKFATNQPHKYLPPSPPPKQAMPKKIVHFL